MKKKNDIGFLALTIEGKRREIIGKQEGGNKGTERRWKGTGPGNGGQEE